MIATIKPCWVKWLHMLLLTAAIAVAYARVLDAGFMNWDDLDYVFNTRDINSGISVQQFKHWFSQNYLGNYQPLPVFSYALDHFIAGPNPFVYHLHSLLWHLGTSLLVYYFFGLIQDNKWLAFFVALLFAIHPVQTESVSWIAARNKSMNAFFYFSAMSFYVSYVKTGNKKAMWWVILCGLLAYLCKATALALPFALFAIDIWLQRRLNTVKIWLEKLPLLLAGLPIALVTLAAQAEVNFLQHHGAFGWSNIVFAGYALVQYVIHLLIPVQLSVLYPYPISVTFLHLLYFVPAICMIAFMVFAYLRKWREWAGGSLFFIVNLLPVLQLVQFGETLMADRYLYIACLGLWYPLMHQLFNLCKKKWRPLSATISTLICVVLLILTFARNAIWMNEVNFWTSVLDRFPESAVAHYSMGAAYMKKGDLVSAAQHMNIAVKYDPENYKAWCNKGSLHFRQGNSRKALWALNKSISLFPYQKAYFVRAMLYHQLRNYELAMNDITKVLTQQPDNARACYIKADCIEQLGRPGDAIRYYDLAVAYDDREPLFLIRRGLLEAKSGNRVAALNDLDKAVALKSGNGESFYYRALIKYDLGQNPCEDLQLAFKRGYSPAGEALKRICR